MTVEQLAAELLGGDAARRVDAADRLATMGEGALPATCALVEACRDASLRDLCVGALEELGPPSADALPRLAELCADPDGMVAYWAATLLGRAGATGMIHRGSLEGLANRIAAPDYARKRAQWALERLAP